MKIIVPWAYGDKQEKIMAEEGLLSDEIILDAELGKILNKAFFAGENFGEYLGRWTESVEKISAEAGQYLKRRYGNGIAVELNRSPRISYNVAPSYFTSFAYLSEIWKEKGLSRSAVEMAEKIEANQKMRAIAYPGTFSWKKNYKGKYPDEILMPPTERMPAANVQNIKSGIFVTKTGIPKLERLYESAEKLGLKVYSSDKYSPKLVTNKNIVAHFARSGWGSVWLSLLAEKPIVVPEYDLADDPEIYFNNLAIEELGIGMIYRGEPLKEILERLEKAKESCRKIKKDILARWGTLDGNAYCAKVFAKDFVLEG